MGKCRVNQAVEYLPSDWQLWTKRPRALPVDYLTLPRSVATQMDMISGGIRWQIPNRLPSRTACWVRPRWIEPEEFNDALPVLVGRAVLVLFPFLDGGVGDAKAEQISQLCHGQLHIDPLFAEVLSHGSWSGRIAA